MFEILVNVEHFLANKDIFARKMKICQSRGREQKYQFKSLDILH